MSSKNILLKNTLFFRKYSRIGKVALVKLKIEESQYMFG
jgi:hypothetical protein